MVDSLRIKDILLLMVMASTVAACTSQNFMGGSNSGGGAKKDKPAPAQIAAPTSTPTPSTIASNCTEAKLYSVQTSQSFVDQKSAAPSIDVQLTFLPCPAQTANLSLPIMFDLGGDMEFSNPASPSIGYELTIAGSTAQTGQMTFLIGTDLFGHTGSDWGHFESSAPMQVSPSITSATLSLKLTTLKLLNVANGNGTATANFSIPLNIRVGQSVPVTSTITLTPR